MVSKNINQEELIYTWDDYKEDVNSILKCIKNSFWDIKAIYGIPRGGLVLGTTLSNILDVPLFFNLDDAIQYLINKGENIPREKILIVDDIADTGNTLINIPEILEFKSVTLFKKDVCRFSPNFWCREAKYKDWVVFCWER